MDVIKCANCGAEIEASMEKCPYCGYINEAGATKAHREIITKLEDEMAESITEADEALSKDVRKTGKSSVIGIVIVLLIAGVIALFFFIFARYFDKTAESTTPQRAISELAFQEENFPIWDELLENGKYDEAVKLYEAALEEGHGIYAYKAHDFLSAYSRYDELKSTLLPKLDDGKADSKEKEAITYDTLVFYYRGYGSVTNEQQKVLDDIRDNYMMGIIHERLGLSDEELDILESYVKDGGSNLVDRSMLGLKTKKYYEGYK